MFGSHMFGPSESLSTPDSSKNNTTSMCPWVAAKCNGVRPIEEPVSFPTPASISTRTTSKWPLAAAKCNGVSRKKVVGFSWKTDLFAVMGRLWVTNHTPENEQMSKPSMVGSNVLPIWKHEFSGGVNVNVETSSSTWESSTKSSWFFCQSKV